MPRTSRRPHATPTRGEGRLTVVGTGICGIGQITLEATESIKRCDLLLYVTIEPSTELWLRSLCSRAESLSPLYAPGKHRSRTYRQMADRIVAEVRKGLKVCVAFYGHPGVFVESTHSAIERLRSEGYEATMLPGVSLDGHLFADLGINPGARGMQSYEATSFLLYRKHVEPTSDLLLWQVGVLGEVDARKEPARPERLRALKRRLLQDYPERHVVAVYYAATFPGSSSSVERFPLAELDRRTISPLATLYVEGLPARRPSKRILTWLGRVPT